MPRIYIIDERMDVRSALAERLARASDLEVIGHSGDAAEVIQEIPLVEPDIVLVETKRSDGMGLEILRQVSSLPKSPRVAVLTSYPSTWERKAAQRAGAEAYLLKDIDSEELIRRICALV
ncbi:MAG: response regulator [Anaerolineales bacterium]|jgi:DNA-binding NarL/FixJ family response regulator